MKIRTINPKNKQIKSNVLDKNNSLTDKSTLSIVIHNRLR